MRLRPSSSGTPLDVRLFGDAISCPVSSEASGKQQAVSHGGSVIADTGLNGQSHNVGRDISGVCEDLFTESTLF